MTCFTTLRRQIGNEEVLNFIKIIKEYSHIMVVGTGRGVIF